MELADGTKDVVDPEVRAYVSSLVTAVSSFPQFLRAEALRYFLAWRKRCR